MADTKPAPTGTKTAPTLLKVSTDPTTGAKSLVEETAAPTEWVAHILPLLPAGHYYVFVEADA